MDVPAAGFVPKLGFDVCGHVEPADRETYNEPVITSISPTGACVGMIQRRYVFPGVLEMNYQSQRRMGVNVYLIDGGTEFALIDVGFLDELPDVLELIRQMDFSLSACQ